MDNMHIIENKHTPKLKKYKLKERSEIDRKEIEKLENK